MPRNHRPPAAEPRPAAHLHHVHVFASDIEAAVAWWRDKLGGEVVFDGDFGGARNVFMQVGAGRLHLYDQPPRGAPGGAWHHVGIQTDDLPALHRRLVAEGVPFRSGIREFGGWRYIMCAAPDRVLIELFQIDTDTMPPALARYFALELSGTPPGPGRVAGSPARRGATFTRGAQPSESSRRKGEWEATISMDSATRWRSRTR